MIQLAKLESLAKIVGVCVACFGIFNYYDGLQQEKVNRSLSYFDEFHSGRVFDARIAVGEMSYEWLNLQRQDGRKLTGEEITQVILSDLSQTPGVIHFDLITEFFQRSKKCIETEACHKETLVGLLSDHAEALYVFFLPKIVERQGIGDDGSDGLLCFASKFRSDACI